MFFFIYFKIQNPKGTASNMTEPIYSKLFDATARRISVYLASRELCVSESTLRDRTGGNITLDIKVGVETPFT